MADRLRLVAVTAEGAEGEQLGTLTRRDDDRIVASGSPVAADLLQRVMLMGQCDQATAFAKLVETGWSNGKLMLVHEDLAH